MEVAHLTRRPGSEARVFELMKPHAEGENFRIEITGGIAVCRIWKRPDVDSATGAQFALKIREAVTTIGEDLARGAILDVSDAPAVAGPITQEHIGRVLAWWEATHRRIAVIVGDQALKAIQMTRLVREHAPNHGRVLSTTDEGMAWVTRAPVTRGRR